MGFDIYGKSPINSQGEYFRNNIWWWRRLWDYVCNLCPELISEKEAENGHYNSGQHFSKETAIKISNKITESIKNKQAYEYKKKIDLLILSAKKQNKQNPKDHDYNEDYPFTITNLKEFAKFCKNSGGFNIF